MGKYVSPHPLPSEHEREILTILIEECAEVQQRATKMLRFGVDEIQDGQPFTNKARLSNEVGQLHHMIERTIKAGLIDGKLMLRGSAEKAEKLEHWMQSEQPRCE